MAAAATSISSLHIAMYPWFAFGHLYPFLQLSNKLAKKGHRVSFFVPAKTESKLQLLNRYPNLITFIPITVPHVDGLPIGAETTADVIPNPSQINLIMTAMDRTQPDIENLLHCIKPNFIFFDFSYWMPKLARRLGIKSIYYCVISAVTIGYYSTPSRKLLTDDDLTKPPPGYPSSDIRLTAREAQFVASVRSQRFGNAVTFSERHFIGLTESDALAFKSCREMEGDFVDYLQSEFQKPVLLTGSVDLDLQKPKTVTLEERWEKWLSKFKAGSVIYCALGSEWVLEKDQFQELLLGFELSNMPFLATLKPPEGINTVEDAMPDGFENRVEGRGIVYGGWVQQDLILSHPSVGCFVTHCGSGSLSEALIQTCQLVMLPHISDHIFRARLMGNVFKVGVEVEKREEDGFFTKESVCKAVKIVTDDDEENEIGREIRANRANLRELLVDPNLEESYINSFIHSLQELV